MRSLVIIILAAALGWSAYWFVGKSIRQSTLNDWFNEKSENGWIVQNSLLLRGFPNRFDAIIKNIKLSNPKSGLEWSANQFEILQLSYKPNHFIVLGPLEQKLKISGQELLIISQKLRGSLVFDPKEELELNRTTISSENLQINFAEDTFASTEKIILALRKTNSTENEYDIGLDLTNFSSDKFNLKEYDPTGTMPIKFGTFRLDVSAKFDEPITQRSFEHELKNISNLKINNTNLEWGSFKLKASGNLILDSDGYPNGKVTLRASNWEQLLDLALNNGELNNNTKNTIRTLFSLFAAISGDKQELEIPLKFSNKKIFVGIIPILDSPRINFY